MKVIMYFFAAIWGVVFGILVPITLMFDIEGVEKLPAFIPVMWIITSFVCFIAPCVLVKLELHKIAAGFTLCGFVMLFVIHFLLLKNSVSSGIAFFYLPLVCETIAVCLIALFSDMGEIRRKRYQKKKAKIAPAPSILGKGTYQTKVGFSEESEKQLKKRR